MAIHFETELMSGSDGTTPASSRLMQSISRMFGDFARAQQASRDVEALMRLSDRELRDIGINRGDIARVAYERNIGKL